MLPGGRSRRQGEPGLDAGGARKTGLATMPTERSPRFVDIVVAALLILTVACPLAPAALAQTGGTLVIGLDQEPPTLDPHASPSAVTYQIIASVTENVAKDHATIARNRAYTRKAPWSDRSGPAYLDSIVWKFVPEAGTRVTTLESGETQAIYQIPAQSLPRLEKNTGLRVEKTPWPGAPRIWLLNTTKPPLDDVRVRRAINYAVDKDALLATVARVIALKAFAPLTAVMLDDPALRQAYPFDQAKAAALLAESGWQPGAGGIRTKAGQRLEILLNAIDYGGGPEPAVQLIQSSLRDVGIDVKLKTQARPPWYEDNYRCATHGPVMFLRSIDPDGLFSLFHSSFVGGNFNWSCVKNAKLDQLLEQGRREFDPAKRRAIYLSIEKLALEEALTVPLLDDLSVWAYRANVQGAKYNFNAYPVLSDVTIRR